jgi:4-hydroxythreonine-4-phosphate dehydrogenase
MERPRIAVTMGDPAGVGPEVCLHLLANRHLARNCLPVIFGDAAILDRVARSLGLTLDAVVLSPEQWLSQHDALDGPAVVDLSAVEPDAVEPGRIGAHTGRAAYAYVNAALDAALAGQVSAVTTGPLNKEALHLAGIDFPGHTEIFAARTRTRRFCMMQYSAEITCSFVTVHVGYAEVPSLLSAERILEVIELTDEALQRIRGRKPKLVVCGLNPHAGEHGLFGNREEERFILPALEAGRMKGIQLEGPLPPDTAFLPERRRVTDGFICMYHDQGHIPLKALAFDSAVNVTLGLPVVRTSVDHGTALDIAWQGKAHPTSLFAAVRLAIELTTGAG